MISKFKRIFCYKRDGYKCTKCGINENLTLDHVVPQSLGGKDNINNLQTMCFTCNQEKKATVKIYVNHTGVKKYVKKFNVVVA